ncbi:hypothetical protein FOPE_05594 [Fonsecaea pedrosoi]|nr:hypothetical protein FOPE_05594 [Fonsecaea pedrosoi]
MTLSQDEIIDRCGKAKPQDLVAHIPYGKSILKLSDGIAVEFGYGVTEYEAHGQDKAYQILDHDIVRVPKVYDFFQDGQGRGYLAMDFMEGQTQDSYKDHSQLKALFRILDHFAIQTSEKPGSFGGGPSRALLFGESDPPTFDTIDKIERWYNMRHLVPGATLSFQKSELVLCHLDLFPRNILWHPDQPPCVPDWSSAGYYPRIFEACSQLIREWLEQSGGVLQIPIPECES